MLLNRRAVLRAGGGVALLAATGTVSSGAWASTDSLDSLRAQFQGDIVLPTDPEYPFAKQMQFAEYDAIHPQAIAYAETVGDVQLAVRTARQRGLEVRTRSGGHNFSGWSTGPGVIIDVSRISAVSQTGSTIHVGPGAQAIDLHTKLSLLGKQAIAGTCPTVCFGGFVSGGGIGYQTRKFGLGIDRLASAQIVLADGSLLKVSESQNRDLFWALRGGGGGNFGIVVDFEIQQINAPQVVQFDTLWPWDRAQEIFAAWQTWSMNGSRNMGSSLVFVLPDAAPGAVPLILVTGVYHGPKPEFDTALAELGSLSGAQPVNVVARDLPYSDGMRAAYGCADLSTEQCHRVGTNPNAALPRTGLMRESYRLFSRPFSASALHQIITAWEGNRRAGQHRYLHCIALGGKANDVSRTATAYVHRDAEFLIGFVAQVDHPTSEDTAAAAAVAQEGARLLDPLSVGAYVNFPGSTLPGWQTKYYGKNYPRLVEVKQRYDPTNFFRHQRSIGA